jgi:hypothetical protein
MMRWHLTLPPRDIVGPSIFALLAGGLAVATVAIGYALLARPASGAEHGKNSASESCLPASLRGALAEVRAACGRVDVVSTLRPHARIPTGHVSLHAACQAVDFRPSKCGCAYRVLASWPYGLSLDCARMHHIHLSAPGIRNEGRFYHHHVTTTLSATPRVFDRAKAGAVR